ncbi:MAG: SDR family NAD(P)-dependent oxidoreductase [Verrucomicrobiales bacterium]|nr:SDR family NAD(P)-dependent oxidoreductase [Verrucomicrobiales bacterium]
MRKKTTVITGVSRGLGRAMATGFAEHGHRVIGCARSADSLTELQEELGQSHSFSPVDVADDTAVKAWAESTISEFGAPDLLINCAALINRSAPLWEISNEEFSTLTRVNIDGTANVIRHYIPSMIEAGRGIIVNFSSGWGRTTSPEVAPYCATKWAIEGLTQALAAELPHGVAAVAFNPGIINTEMLQSCFGEEGAAHYSPPDDWARQAVPFLDSLDDSSNGQALTCPGQ